MAWNSVSIEINGSTILGHMQGSTVSVPFSSGFEVGNSFKVGGVEYLIETAIDIAGRNEIILITAKEVKNDKSKTRRNEPKPKRAIVQSEDQHGCGDED
jgi:hypothetical protein